MSDSHGGRTRQFRMPDAGEGLTEAEIVGWRVAPGDTVAVNEVICEIETAKAVVELPSPYAGTVTELLVQAGVTVAVGTPILSITEFADGSQDPAVPSGDDRPSTPDDRPVPPAAAGPDEAPPSANDEGRTSVLVGYGPASRGSAGSARHRRWAAAPAPGDRAAAATTTPVGPRALAKPPVRRLARDRGIDLTALAGSGSGGVITRADVLAYEGGTPPRESGSIRDNGSRPSVPPVVPAEGDVRVPVRGLRRATAEAMVASAFSAPHVTEWVQVDVTATMEFVTRMRGDKEFTGLRVSPLLVVAKAVCMAARRNPGVNATWDEAAQEVVLRKHVNLGIAASTPRGLVVPVIHQADAMHMPRLAQELTDVVATAREGRLQPAQMAGGTLTITNVGVFGVDGGTPILPPGQAAILCMGQIRLMPWVHEGVVVPRYVTTLSVSFDHRLVDGELGSGFLNDVGAVLSDPARGLIWA